MEGAVRASSFDNDDTLVQYQYTNVVLLGSRDSGKSTLCGRLLQPDTRTLERSKKYAAEIGRESSYLAWLTDRDRDWRLRGTTIGSNIHAIPNTNASKYHRITLTDTPGNRTFMKNKIPGVIGNDIALLVIDLKRFKTNIKVNVNKNRKKIKEGEINAQIITHFGDLIQELLLIKALDIPHVVIAINKCDQINQKYQTKFDKIRHKFDKYKIAEKCGISDNLYHHFVPISAYHNINIFKAHPNNKSMFNYHGPCLMDVLYSFRKRPVQVKRNEPFVAISKRWFKIKGVGLVMVIYIVSGKVQPGDVVIMQCGNKEIEIKSIQWGIHPVECAHKGQCVAVAFRCSGRYMSWIKHRYVQCILMDPKYNEAHYRPIQCFDVDLTVCYNAKPLFCGSAVDIMAYTKISHGLIADVMQKNVQKSELELFEYWKQKQYSSSEYISRLQNKKLYNAKKERQEKYFKKCAKLMKSADNDTYNKYKIKYKDVNYTNKECLFLRDRGIVRLIPIRRKDEDQLDVFPFVEWPILGTVILKTNSYIVGYGKVIAVNKSYSQTDYLSGFKNNHAIEYGAHGVVFKTYGIHDYMLGLQPYFVDKDIMALIISYCL
eukprot:166263_1